MKVPWSKPSIDEKEKKAVRQVMDSGWITQGSETEAFEKELADYVGCQYVVCVNNGTAALRVALLAHDIKKLVIPAYAYPSLAEVTKNLGIYAVFNDVNPRTIQMIPEKWQGEWWYLPTSYAGLPLDTEDWVDLNVVEDAAEAFGAASRKKRTGAQGWTATFSFHAAKLITTIEGGAIATDAPEVAEKCRKIRHRATMNFQTTDVVSTIGRVQLKKLPTFLDNRQRIAQCYEESLKDTVGFQTVPEHVTLHPWMMFPVFVENPRLLAEKLGEHGIETRTGWKPLYPTKNALHVSKHVLCLPIYNDMPLEEAEYVAQTLREQI